MTLALISTIVTQQRLLTHTALSRCCFGAPHPPDVEKLTQSHATLDAIRESTVYGQQPAACLLWGCQ